MRIKREIELLLHDIKENNRNLNILLRAPSGYGKTTCGLIILQRLGIENAEYLLPNNDGTLDNLNLGKRFHFIDEAHLIKEPERLYPLMDSSNYTFIIATNESGTLKEPLRNRCIQFIFSKYSFEELKLIVRENLGKYNLSNEMIELITGRVKGNPRIAKIICTRLGYVFSGVGVPNDINELIYILENILQIDENGITELDKIYLNYLQSCGGLAGINTLINGTHIDKETITGEIEPNLINLGLIQITSRGRKYEAN
jgi:Holliday junction resolvasome RuvABC ATP-dependent DNA helicase subunit